MRNAPKRSIFLHAGKKIRKKKTLARYGFADSHPDALGGFTDQTRKYGLSVEIPEMLLERIQEKKRESLKAVLAHDPRPSYQDDPERVYGMEFAGYEIKFMVENGILRVTDIELR